MGRCEAVGNSMSYGNGQGLGLLQELENAKEDREHLKRMMAALEANQKAHQKAHQEAQAAEIRDFAQFKEAQKVKNQIFEGLCKSSTLRCDDISRVVHLLASSSDAYVDIRNRFMDVYRQDKPNHSSLALAQNIAKGNLRAHGGDCAIDALLFHSVKKSDPELFIEIYGVSVENVLLLHECKNFDAIVAVNKYGTLKVERGQSMPEELVSVYDKFIKALLADPIQKPTDDPQSTMGGLYLRFIAIIRKYNL